jgi:hypothetical protein
MSKEVGTSEAVRQYDAHPATILRLILTGRVSAHKDANGRWLIRRSDLDRWNRQRVRRKSFSTTQPETDTEQPAASTPATSAVELPA